MSMKPKAALYTVTSVIERMDIDEKGRFKRLVEVAAVTVTGTEFTLTIPKTEFSKKLADELLTKEATELEAVKGLSK